MKNSPEEKSRTSKNYRSRRDPNQMWIPIRSKSNDHKDILSSQSCFLSIQTRISPSKNNAQQRKRKKSQENTIQTRKKKMEEEYFNYTQIKSQIRGIFLFLKKKMIDPKGFDEGSSSPVGRCR